MICENAMDNVVPRASRNMRRTAMSWSVIAVWAAVVIGLVCVGQNTAQPYLQAGKRVDECVITRKDYNGCLRPDP